MGGPKTKRSASVIQAENIKKETQLWYEEAKCHVKAGNLHKALFSYNKVKNMHSEKIYRLIAQKQPLEYILIKLERGEAVNFLCFK